MIDKCPQCGAPMEPERRGWRGAVAAAGGLLVGFSETLIVPSECSECGERRASE